MVFAERNSVRRCTEHLLFSRTREDDNNAASPASERPGLKEPCAEHDRDLDRPLCQFPVIRAMGGPQALLRAGGTLLATLDAFVWSS